MLRTKSPRGLRHTFRIKIKTTLLLPSLFLIVVIGGIVAVWRVFVVRQIWVDFTSDFGNAEVIKGKLSDSLGGKPLVFLSEKETTKLLQKNFPEVSNVSLTCRWPTGVDAKVSSWSETLVVGASAPYLLVNNQGLIFGTTDSKDSGTYLPLDVSRNLTVGQVVAFKNLNSLVVISNFMSLEKLQGKFTQIKEDSASVVVGQTTIFLPLGQKVTTAINTFWKVYRNYQINGKTVKTIDVRFDNPVITE